VVTYVNPLVAVLLGVAVLGEPLTAGIAVALPLIVGGSVVATSRSPQRRRASTEAAG
jgi:drug/metabolite transporter (DMT)-like permease